MMNKSSDMNTLFTGLTAMLLLVGIVACGEGGNLSSSGNRNIEPSLGTLDAPKDTLIVSTERLVITFTRQMDAAEIESFALSNSLIVPIDFESESRRVFVFDINRTIVPAETTAVMYAEKIALRNTELVSVASAEKTAGTIGGQ